MEKIIAVVVMIAIVIGLIATAVLPMVNSMNDQGTKANDQMDMLSAGLEDGQVLGSMIYSDFTSKKAKLVAAGSEDSTDGTLSFVVKDENGTVLYTGLSTTTLNDLKGAVAATEVYTKTETYHPSGKVASIVYERVVR